MILHVTDESFDQDVLQSDLPVLLDFWAEWCGPCKMIAPVLEQLAPVYQGQVVIAKINVDENRQVPERYGIRGIPTLLLFKNGQVAVNRVGALAASQLTAFLDDNLKETK